MSRIFDGTTIRIIISQNPVISSGNILREDFISLHGITEIERAKRVS